MTDRNRVAELKELRKRYNRGEISQEDFESAKTQLMSVGPAQPSRPKETSESGEEGRRTEETESRRPESPVPVECEGGPSPNEKREIKAELRGDADRGPEVGEGASEGSGTKMDAVVLPDSSFGEGWAPAHDSSPSPMRPVLLMLAIAVIIGGIWILVENSGKGGASIPGDRRVSVQPLRRDPAIGMPFRLVPSGTFQMGSNDGNSDEKPMHRVTITRGLWMGETEVTQGQWRSVMGSNPSKFSSCGDDCPVEQVSWNAVVKYANALSKKAGFDECYRISGESVTFKGLGCEGYRLPTEAEWEYAARAGTSSLYAGGADLGAVGWYSKNSGSKTHRAGTKNANAWGLRDMSGNVLEWVLDWKGTYPTDAVTDPTGPSSGSFRVWRGGSCDISARDCRSASRHGYYPGSRFYNLGFRLARTSE